jgi:hypothetical protein
MPTVDSSSVCVRGRLVVPCDCPSSFQHGAPVELGDDGMSTNHRRAADHVLCLAGGSGAGGRAIAGAATCRAETGGRIKRCQLLGWARMWQKGTGAKDRPKRTKGWWTARIRQQQRKVASSIRRLIHSTLNFGRRAWPYAYKTHGVETGKRIEPVTSEIWGHD